MGKKNPKDPSDTLKHRQYPAKRSYIYEKIRKIHNSKQNRFTQPVTPVTIEIQYRDALNSITSLPCWAHAQIETCNVSMYWSTYATFSAQQHPYTQTC